jgi:hypothetical protein
VRKEITVSTTLYAVSNVDGGISTEVLASAQRPVFVVVVSANQRELERLYFPSAEDAVQFAQDATL